MEKSVETRFSECLKNDFVCLQGDVKLETGAKLVPPVVIGEGSVIKAGARVGRMAIIGPGCTIEAGAIVEESVIQEGCSLGENVLVRHCIIGRDVTVGDASVISGGAIIGEGSQVGGHNVLSNRIRIYPGTKVKEGSIKF
jgi:NDP-sugar pyrophosphorylase family protein